MASNNPFYIEPANPLQALMAGVQGYEGAQKRSKADAIQAARKEAGDLYAKGGDTRGALAKLIELGDGDTIKALSAMGPKTTDLQSNYNTAVQQGYKGSFMDYQTALKRAGANSTTVNMPPAERAYDTQVGGDYGKLFSETQKAGRSALGTQGVLNRMETLVQDPSFYSGGAVAENVVLPFKQAIAGLGGDPNSARGMEEFRGLSNKAALDGMGGSLGTGFSNADRDFITTQYPNLANTPEGNKMRIEGLRKIEQRKIDIAKASREYAKRNGRIDAGFEAELTEWAERNPLFPRNAAPPAPAAPAPGKTTTGVPWRIVQ